MVNRRSIPVSNMPGTSFECRHRRRASSPITLMWESRSFGVRVVRLCKLTDRSVESWCTERGRLAPKSACWKCRFTMMKERALCQATRSCGFPKSRARIGVSPDWKLLPVACRNVAARSARTRHSSEWPLGGHRSQSRRGCLTIHFRAQLR